MFTLCSLHLVSSPWCFDNNWMCDSWAKNGECQKNPRYMVPNCKKSCKKCGMLFPDSFSYKNTPAIFHLSQFYETSFVLFALVRFSIFFLSLLAYILPLLSAVSGLLLFKGTYMKKISSLIIHEIFSFACDCYKHVT